MQYYRLQHDSYILSDPEDSGRLLYHRREPLWTRQETQEMSGSRTTGKAGR